MASQPITQAGPVDRSLEDATWHKTPGAQGRQDSLVDHGIEDDSRVMEVGDQGRGIEVTQQEAKQDIDALLWSMRLSSTRRYFHQRYWEQETADAEYASKVEPFPRLESVAEHSWHVADIVLMVGPRYPSIDIARAAMLAVLHDKMEIKTGDLSPVGRDGTGEKTHAFNENARLKKDDAERTAAERYLIMLSGPASLLQAALLREILDGTTDEARFVKAVDKLQALAFVVAKKAGRMTDKHLSFTMRYSEKVLQYWPSLMPHLNELRSRLFDDIARVRHSPVEDVLAVAYPDQPSLFGLL